MGNLDCLHSRLGVAAMNCAVADWRPDTLRGVLHAPVVGQRQLRSLVGTLMLSTVVSLQETCTVVLNLLVYYVESISQSSARPVPHNHRHGGSSRHIVGQLRCLRSLQVLANIGDLKRIILFISYPVSATPDFVGFNGVRLLRFNLLFGGTTAAVFTFGSLQVEVRLNSVKVSDFTVVLIWVFGLASIALFGFLTHQIKRSVGGLFFDFLKEVVCLRVFFVGSRLFPAWVGGCMLAQLHVGRARDSRLGYFDVRECYFVYV